MYSQHIHSSKFIEDDRRGPSHSQHVYSSTYIKDDRRSSLLEFQALLPLTKIYTFNVTLTELVVYAVLVRGVALTWPPISDIKI